MGSVSQLKELLKSLFENNNRNLLATQLQLILTENLKGQDLYLCPHNMMKSQAILRKVDTSDAWVKCNRKAGTKGLIQHALQNVKLAWPRQAADLLKMGADKASYKIKGAAPSRLIITAPQGLEQTPSPQKCQELLMWHRTLLEDQDLWGNSNLQRHIKLLELRKRMINKGSSFYNKVKDSL